MSNEQALPADAAAGMAARRPAEAPRHLFGPAADFLCLGGASLLLLPIVFALPEKEFAPAFNSVFLAVAFVVNYPHFAFSYQVFYEGFRRKAFGAEGDAALRARYVAAGIAVPAALAAFLAVGMATADAKLLGHGASLMGFLVGWHYVKQGYGMLMVDAALKRRYFDAAEKRILLINCYAVWALAWLTNASFAGDGALWGIAYPGFDVPPLVLQAGACIAFATSAMTISVLVKKWRTGGGLPASGVAAYLVSLYLWLLIMRWNTLWLLVVPTLHSLQYLAVVARYRLNRYRDEAGGEASIRGEGPVGRVLRYRYRRRAAGFAVVGVALGFAGFWGVPELFQILVPYDRAALGGTAFLFVFWIFINVHHYFLDNVMWRSQNPDIRKYLFARGT